MCMCVNNKQHIILFSCCPEKVMKYLFNRVGVHWSSSMNPSFTLAHPLSISPPRKHALIITGLQGVLCHYFAHFLLTLSLDNLVCCIFCYCCRGAVPCVVKVNFKDGCMGLFRESLPFSLIKESVNPVQPPALKRW